MHEKRTANVLWFVNTLSPYCVVSKLCGFCGKPMLNESHGMFFKIGNTSCVRNCSFSLWTSTPRSHPSSFNHNVASCQCFPEKKYQVLLIDRPIDNEHAPTRSAVTCDAPRKYKTRKPSFSLHLQIWSWIRCCDACCQHQCQHRHQMASEWHHTCEHPRSVPPVTHHSISRRSSTQPTRVISSRNSYK